MHELTRMDTEKVNRTCHYLLYSLADDLCTGVLTTEEFVGRLLEVEEWLTEAGFKLTVSHTLDEWIYVALRAPREYECCLKFEFHPTTCDFRNEKARYQVRVSASEQKA